VRGWCGTRWTRPVGDLAQLLSVRVARAQGPQDRPASTAKPWPTGSGSGALPGVPSFSPSHHGWAKILTKSGSPALLAGSRNAEAFLYPETAGGALRGVPSFSPSHRGWAKILTKIGSPALLAGSRNAEAFLYPETAGGALRAAFDVLRLSQQADTCAAWANRTVAAPFRASQAFPPAIMAGPKS